MQKFGMSNKETLFRHMPDAEKRWMEAEITVQKKSRHVPWYNVPMAILAQLVYKVHKLYQYLICILYFLFLPNFYLPYPPIGRLSCTI